MRKLTAVVVVACVAVLVPCVANGAGNQRVNDPIPLAAPLDKAALTADIVSTFRPEAEARGYDLSAWEAELRGVLAARTEAQLLSAKNATSWADAKRILGFAGEPSAANSSTPVGTSSRAALSGMSPTFGDDATNLVYFPVQPCRLVDSRIGTGTFAGPISGYRNISVNAGFAAQGGAAAGCGIPTDPAALALNVVAVSPSGAGYIKMYPYSSVEPNASILNFTPGQNLANMLIIPQCQLCGGDITFAVFSASTHVVIDVLGYFWSPTPHDGRPSTGRGYAKVYGATIDVNYSRGFSSVTNPSTGVYCLVPTFDWPNVKTPPILSIDYSSSDNGATAHWRSSGIGCPATANQIVVDTFDATGTFSNEGFQILVP